MGINKKTKYFTKSLLIESNIASIREKRTNSLNEELLNGLDDGMIYPAYEIIKHTKTEVRVRVLLDEKANYGLLDMSPARYKTLPYVTALKDGTTIVEPVDSSKRPYANEREWRDSTIRQPVRRQEKFRKKVLEAYSMQCAVCSINIKSLLRAAHIVPVASGGDDSINNGICLCATHEIAFDRGILRIMTDGKIIIDGDHNLKIDYTKIRLPDNKEDFPSAKYLQTKNESLKANS